MIERIKKRKEITSVVKHVKDHSCFFLLGFILNLIILIFFMSGLS